MKKLTEEQKTVKKWRAKPWKGETVLALRTCCLDMTSKYRFKWKESGMVIAPDWHPRKKCGNGLHGLLWGQGDPSNLTLLNSDINQLKWMVVEVLKSEIVSLDEKIKFPRCKVKFVGDKDSALAFLRGKMGEVKLLPYENHVGESISIVGLYGTAKTKNANSLAVVRGDYGSAISGNSSISLSIAKSKSGHFGASIARKHAISGNYGNAIAKNFAEVGIQGMAKSKNYVKGDRGSILIVNNSDYFYSCIVGQNGIEPNTWYYFDSWAEESCKFTKVSEDSLKEYGLTNEPVNCE
jgi:hypothetical protein